MSVSTTYMRQGVSKPGYLWLSGQYPVTYDPVSRMWVGSSWSEQLALRDYAFEAYAQNRSTAIPWTGVLYPNWLGSYLISTSGPIPSYSHTETTEGLRISNASFSRKVQEGKIVVSDFRSRMSVTVTATPEFVIDESHDEGVHGVYLSTMGIFTPVKDPVGWYSDCFSFNGKFYSGGFLALPLSRDTGSWSELPSDYSVTEHASRITLAFLRSDTHSNIITDTLAKASTGTFDALTALAEQVETNSSIVNFCITILRMYKDAKNKEIRLYNKLKRLERIKDPSAQTRKEVREIANAISSVWLSYRLSINPFVKMVEDLLQLDTTSNRMYLRYRDGADIPLPIGYGSEDTSLTVKHRCFIKRLYESWLSSLGISPIRTAWELVPLSFVVDRYMSIGNALSGISPNLSVDEGATYSWKLSDGATGTYNGVQYTVTASAYRRQVINPSHYCGISYPSDRTLEQKLDHLALVWQIFLKDFHFSKKGK